MNGQNYISYTGSYIGPVHKLDEQNETICGTERPSYIGWNVVDRPVDCLKCLKIIDPNQ